MIIDRFHTDRFPDFSSLWVVDGIHKVVGKYLGKMVRMKAGKLPNLLSATEAVGQNQRRIRQLSEARQKYALGSANRNVVMFCFKTERPGHSAASGIEIFE